MAGGVNSWKRVAELHGSGSKGSCGGGDGCKSVESLRGGEGLRMIGAKVLSSLFVILDDSWRAEMIDERREEESEEVDELSLRSRLRFGRQLDFWPEDRGIFDERCLERSLHLFVIAADCRGDNEASSSSASSSASGIRSLW